MTKILEINNVPVFMYSLRETAHLVQITKWLPRTKTELKYLAHECQRINTDPDRTCFVFLRRSFLALFANDVT